MGLTTIGGLPAHPLLVHLVVVLVPISALLLVLAVCWPAARIRLGLAPAVIALITLIAVPVTTYAGEWLEKQIPEDPLVQAHAELGDQMLFWSIGVFVLAATWWILHSTRFAAWRADPSRYLDLAEGVAGCRHRGRCPIRSRRCRLGCAGISDRRERSQGRVE